MKKFTQGYTDYMHSEVPFGKYKGRFFKEVPTGYLKWAIKTLDPFKVTPFVLELQRREDQYR